MNRYLSDKEWRFVQRAFVLVAISCAAFLIDSMGDSFAGAKLNGRWVT